MATDCETLVAEAIGDMHQQAENIIYHALLAAGIPAPISPSDLRHRVARLLPNPSRPDVWLLDGRPLVTFQPMEMAVYGRHGERRQFTRRYEVHAR